MPRSSRARVNTPLPGPSSMTGASSAEIPAVMALASRGLDGAIAPTRSGAESHSRKNDSECMSGQFNASAVQRIGKHAERQASGGERRADPRNAAVGETVAERDAAGERAGSVAEVERALVQGGGEVGRIGGLAHHPHLQG